MKIKNTITIAGHSIHTVFVDNLADENGVLLDGCYNHDLGLIKIDKSLKLKNRETAWLHEVIHALDIIYNIRLTHHQVYQLQTALFALNLNL